MPAMTKEQLYNFLSRPSIAKIATLLPDGSPTVTPIWFEWDPKSESFLLWARKGYGGLNSAWFDNVGRDPRLALLIDDPNPPHGRVLVLGKGRILFTPKNWLQIQRRMTERYVGKEKTQEYLDAMPKVPAGWARVKPERIISWTGERWHRRYLEPGGKSIYRKSARKR